MIRRRSRSFVLLSISLALAGFGAGQLASGAWIHAKARLAQHLLDAAWQETRVSGGERIARPWPWADTWPVARLSLPRLSASFIVLSGDAGSSLAFGPGHNTASALPGRPGTAVISGHRDTHFRALARLRPGDRIEIERPDGVTVAYRIASLEVADTRRDRLHLAEGSPRARPALALVTCWPFNAVQPGGPLRYVVSAYMDSPDRASPGGGHFAAAESRIPNFFSQPPQTLRRKAGPQLKFTSFAQVSLRSSRVGPPTLRHTKAESTGSGTEPRAMPPWCVHDIRRTGQKPGPGGHLANAQRNSIHPRATTWVWIGWKETTTRASRMRLVFEEAREAWRPMGFRAPGLPAAA